MRKLTEEDFWARKKVCKSGCWLWTGNIQPNGYGQLFYQGKHYRPHVLAYIITNGDIPIGYIVCHRCNNKACFNPSHLYAGTAKQNSEDSILFGRLSLRRKNTGKIFYLRSLGYSLKQIGLIVGLSTSGISLILREKRRNPITDSMQYRGL